MVRGGRLAAMETELVALQAENAAPRPTLTEVASRHAVVNSAIDTLWLLMSPDNFYRLVHERGWTKKKCQTWLANAIALLLLRN